MLQLTRICIEVFLQTYIRVTLSPSLIEFLACELKSINQGDAISIMYLNLSKAFDRLSCNILFYKIITYGPEDTILR